jgi:hypothetical protein
VSLRKARDLTSRTGDGTSSISNRLSAIDNGQKYSCGPAVEGQETASDAVFFLGAVATPGGLYLCRGLSIYS